MKRTSLAIFAALVCTSASFVIGQALAQQTSTSQESDQLNGFVGDGTCSGNVMAMGKTPAHATTGKFHGEKTLGGHWVVVHYDEDQTAANPKPYHVVQYFGYDADKKQFITASFDNSGGDYSTGTSPGWKGDSVTFDTTAWMGGKRISARDVFGKSESSMSGHTGMMRDKSGKWVKTDEETCKSS